MYQKSRFSRYDCHKTVPAGIEAVLERLERKARNLRFESKNFLRSLFKRGHSDYDQKGPADDLLRFLINSGCIIEADGEYYLDPERSRHVLRCCEEKRTPGPNPDPVERLKALRAQAEAHPTEPEPETEADDPPSADDASDLGETEDLPDDVLEMLTAPETASVSYIEPILAASPMGDLVPIPLPEPAPPPVAEAPSIESVLYLTPIEMDVWTCIGTLARKYNEHTWRLAAPMSPERLHERWRSSRLECDEEDYFIAFQRFVDHNLLVEVGNTCDEQKTYAIGFDPSSRRTREITERVERVVSEDVLNFIRAVQRREVRTPPGEPVPALDSVLEVDDANGQTLISTRGFERFELVTHAAKAKEFAEAPKLPPPPAPPPRSKPSTPPPPREIRSESDSRLATLRDELRKRIERAQAEIAGWTAQIEAIDAETVRRKDTKRQDLLKKKAEIERQLAALEEA